MIEPEEFNNFIEALVLANPDVKRNVIEQLMEDYGDQYIAENGMVTFPGGNALVDPDA